MIIIFYLAIALLGFFILKTIAPQISLYEKFGLSFLIGTAFHSIFYFFITFNLNGPILHNQIVLLFELLFFYLISKNKPIKSINISSKKINFISIILISISVISFSYITLQSIFWPPYHSDALHLFDFRAKVLLESNTEEFISAGPYNHGVQYPPLTSLIHYFLYQSGLENPKGYYPVLLFSFLITLFGYTLRQTKSINKSLFVTTGTLITPTVMWYSFFALTNIPYMYYFSLGIFYLLDKRKTNQYILSSILLASSIFIRNEPFWIIGLIIILFDNKDNLKRKFIKIIPLLILCLSTIVIWKINFITPNQEINRLARRSTRITTSISTHIQNIPEIIKMIFLQVKQAWGVVLYLFLFIIIIDLIITKKLSKHQKSTLVIIFVFISSIILYTTTLNKWRGMGNIIYRASSLVVPMLWYSIISSDIVNKLLQSQDKIYEKNKQTVSK